MTEQKVINLFLKGKATASLSAKYLDIAIQDFMLDVMPRHDVTFEDVDLEDDKKETQ